jgi:hypothetical protein
MASLVFNHQGVERMDFNFELINIDREKNEYRRIDIKNKSEDLKNYFLKIRDAILDEKESRVFKIASDTAFVT